MIKEYEYFPNLFQSIILSLLLIIFSLIFNFLGSFFITNNFHSIIMVWMNIPVFILTCLIAVYVSKKKPGYFLKNKKIQKRLFIPIFITSLGTIIIIGELTNLLFYFYPIPDYIIDTFKNLLSNKWGVIAAILVAAVTEEIFFRGIILTGLKNNYGDWLGILFSALLFALIHVIPWQVFPAFIAGIFLGWLYIKFESIILCICVHSFNNVIAALPEYSNINIPGIVYDIKAGVQFQPVWLDLFGILMFIYGIYLINRKIYL